MKQSLLVLKVFLILLLLMVAASNLGASPDVVAQLRLYEGFKEIMAPAGVTTSYYLKPISGKEVYLEVDLGEEQASLKKVFNLVDIKLITQAGLALTGGSGDSGFQVVVLNGRELRLQLAGIPGDKNRFKVEVLEAGEKEKPSRSLLESRIYLPEKKTTVLGFEDTAGKIYFLSFHRGEDIPNTATTGKENSISIPADKKPKLIHSVNPKYPPAALENHIEGDVVINATTDTTGKVVDAVVKEGPRELIPTALEAVKQWRYEPYKIDGKAVRVNFTVVTRFKLAKENAETKPINLSAAQKPKLIKSVDPKYPPEALKAHIEDAVVLEAVVDINGFVRDVNVVAGNDLLNEAAIEAIKQWQYEPYYVDGVARPVRITVVIKFRLTEK